MLVLEVETTLLALAQAMRLLVAVGLERKEQTPLSQLMAEAVAVQVFLYLVRFTQAVAVAVHM
jgi:hypothetical protein